MMSDPIISDIVFYTGCLCVAIVIVTWIALCRVRVNYWNQIKPSISPIPSTPNLWDDLIEKEIQSRQYTCPKDGVVLKYQDDWREWHKHSYCVKEIPPDIQTINEPKESIGIRHVEFLEDED